MESIKSILFEPHDEVSQKFSSISEKDTVLLVVKEYDELKSIIEETRIQLIILSAKLYNDNAQIRQLARQNEFLFALYSLMDDPTEKSIYISRGIWFFWNLTNGVGPLIDNLKLIHQRQNLIRRIPERSDIKGNLTDLPFDELLTNLTINGKTVKLELFSPFGRAVLHFNKGILTHARQGVLRGNSVVLNLFLWPGGTFFVSQSEQPASPPNVNASFIALIAEGDYRKEQFWNYWAKKVNFNSPLLFRDTNPKLISPKVNQLRQLFIRQKSLLYLLLASETDVWALIHEIDKLINDGTIDYIPDTENVISPDSLVAEKRSFLTLSESSILEKVFFARHSHINEGKIIIAGASGSGIIEFIRTVSGKLSAPLKQVHNLVFSRVKLNDKIISFFGITIEERFTELMQKLSENMFGFILLIDARNKEELEYTAYIIKSLFSNYPDAIFSVGLTHTEKARAMPLDMIKQTIQLPSYAKLQICNIEDENSIKELIFNMRDIPKSEDEE